MHLRPMTNDCKQVRLAAIGRVSRRYPNFLRLNNDITVDIKVLKDLIEVVTWSQSLPDRS